MMRLKGEMGEEIKAVFVQKSGILLVIAADAICAAWLGELASFGKVSAVFALMDVIADPWASASATEGALALKEDRSRAARLFASWVIDPVFITLLIGAGVAVEMGWAAQWVGEEAAGYMRWALVARAIGHVPMAGVKALRKSGNTRDIIASTWLLSGTNCIGNALSVWFGWGMEGLAMSWAAGEVLAAWLPLSIAWRRGLLLAPTWADLRLVARKSVPLYVAAIPGAGVCALRAVVFAGLPDAVLTPFVAAKQGYQIANNLASNLAKVGVAAVQRGAEGVELAYRWSVYVRLGALPATWYVGGLPGVVMVVLGHYALMSYARLMETAQYKSHALAGASADVVWATLIGVALMIGEPGAVWLFAARYVQQLTYFVFARRK